MHSLIEELWDEWSVCPVEAPSHVAAECAGLILGLLSERGGLLHIGTSRLWVARRLLRLWRRSSWAETWNIADALEFPQSRKGRVQLILPEGLLDRLRAYALDLLETMPLTVSHWSWLRGLWGACGSLYLPRSGYYLALRVSSPPVAELLKKLLSRTRIVWQKRLIHGTQELILRDQQKIVTFLSKTGLTGISLKMEDMAIMRSMRDRANRIRNCDTANIKRTLKVAEEQTRLALKIQNSGMIDSLPLSLRELVEARLRNPEASFSELGEGLSPPITKSTVKYRWQRLIAQTGDMTLDQSWIKEKGASGGCEGEAEDVRAQRCCG